MLLLSKATQGAYFMNDPYFPPPAVLPSVPVITPLPWGWRAVAKATVLIIIGTIILGVVIVGGAVWFGNELDPGAGMTAAPLFALGIGIYAVVALAVYLFAVRTRADGWQLLGLRRFPQGWLLALPFLALVQLLGMGLINTLLVMPFLGGSEFQNPQIEAITGGGALTQQDLLLLLFLIAVVAPIAEELFFRGMLYPLLRRRWSAPVAIGVNGLLFALIHVIPVILPGLFFVGIVLAWVRERSGSLWPCIFLHALQNGVVLLGIYVAVNQGLAA